MKYKNYIFDYGGVIADLDWAKAVAPFQSKLEQASAADKQQFEQRILAVISPYQCGNITTDEFLESMQHLLPVRWTKEQVLQWWNGFVSPPSEQRLECIRNLRQQGAHVYLLSNINDAHWEMMVRPYLESEHWRDCFDRLFLSHLMHMEKPSLQIYQSVIAETGINPSETLYIDDLQENILGGQQAGLQTLLAKGDAWMTQI